jgi:hypothetical protein
MKNRLLALFLLSLVPLLPARADTSLVFNELMYHPETNEVAFEWVEVFNQKAVDLDISNWSIADGIQYTFPAGTVIKGGAYLVVAISPADLMAATGLTNVHGPFTGRLSNNGERLEIRDNTGRVVDRITYGVDGEWPVGPDGSGVSLAKIDPYTASRAAQNWTVSQQMGGTPGLPNFPQQGLSAIQSQPIASGDTWRYNASGEDLGTVWRTPSYSDSSWSSGRPLIYAGNPNVVPGERRVVPTLFSTGLNTNGTPRAGGTPDPNYLLINSAHSTPPPPAIAATVIENHPAWLANDANSLWIGPVHPGTASVNAGNYDYQTRFDLTGFDHASAQLELLLAVDNDLTAVLLNGNNVGITHSGFAAFSSPRTIVSGFLPGQNTLEFRTFNAGTSPNPAGFRVRATATALAAGTNTAVAAGPVTYYFRKSFPFQGDPTATTLRLRFAVADGAIFYLNGAEVHRVNMPGGAVTASTHALSRVALVNYSEFIHIPAASLIEGTNLLAVEVHQAAEGMNEMVFGAELLATTALSAPVPLALNEITGATNETFWLELHNYGTNELSLEGFIIAREGGGRLSHIIAENTVIPGGGFLALTEEELGFRAQANQRIVLYRPARRGVIDALVMNNRLRGRHPDGTGEWLFPAEPTPGALNSFAFRNEIVINEIMYHPRSRSREETWLELHNRGSQTVDLTGWQFDRGIDYRFAPGTTIPAGGYLVVAQNAAHLRTLYPGIPIVGDFAGNLSRREDLLVLKDPFGNPANRVHYFDGGRWPEFADGGGSSLELRDPFADNSRAEAWAASDEARYASWQTYTYRGIAAPSRTPNPDSQWREFVMGLLSAGECLIDDISVIEAPGSASPIQFIGNGDFENGLTGWRVLGTHNRSRVIVDPDNPNNRVLHLVATGPQEHMHNHIEATFIGGRSVVNGREYEISFRAKWLGGNNLLNTRLYFNRVARTTPLPVPSPNGTPGTQNSRHEPNIGPTFSEFQHAPVIPAANAPVTVSVVAQDPQGVQLCQIFWSANSGPWNTAPMTHQGDGIYTGTIPGQPAATIVQFYVRAVDTLGAAATYPAQGPSSGALYKVNDGQANLSLAHNIRIILTPANTALLHASTNVMSNGRIPGTVVFNERRAYYDVGVRLKSSERGRDNPARVGFHITFPTDDLFQGVHPVMLIDRAGGGGRPAQEEIVIRHMVQRVGAPTVQADICRVIAPRDAQTGPAIFAPRFEDEYIETAFENGGEGTLFEMELIYYPTTANAEGYKLPQPDSVQGLDFGNHGDDKENYRYNFMIKNHRDADDYSRFITFSKATSLTGPALDLQTEQTMDLDQWMRAYAIVTLCGVGDMYTFGNHHNLITYLRPSDQRFLYFPWDMDFSFTRGATEVLIGNSPSPVNLNKIITSSPSNLRLLYAHILDHIRTTFNTSYMTYWINHYPTFAPGQNYSAVISYIQQRGDFARTTINNAGGNASFAVTGTNSISTTNSLLTLSGTAPIPIRTILINGIEYPVTWTMAGSAPIGWTVRLALSAGTNVFTVQGLDVHGNAVTNAPLTFTANYTGPGGLPEEFIRISEIMHHPAFPEASFIEIVNSSTHLAFDLTGWRINGLGYTFPGSVMTNRQHLVLAKNRAAFAAAYGAGIPVFDEFTGNLDLDGETLTLIKPGATPEQDLVINKVRYEAVAPWPAAANGGGASLQLIDARQDNSRVANWSDGAGWRFFSFTGTPGGTNLLLFLNAAGELFLDDISLVAGTVPRQGENLIRNGDFETEFAGPWNALGNHAGSNVSTEQQRTGERSLRIVATGPGTLSSVVSQHIPEMIPTSTYTLSFWYLPTESQVTLTARFGSSFRPVINPAPSRATPGEANSTAALLPPFPSLWLNEVQTQNATGPQDGAGEREPWVELVNTGTESISLHDYFLTDDYSNLARWEFPAGTVIAPGAFLVVWLDGQPNATTSSELHTNFRISSTAGSIALSRKLDEDLQIIDYLNFPALAPDQSYGAVPDGQPFTRRVLHVATPGAANDPTSPPVTVYLNEWMASNTRTLMNAANANRFDDWFELYNPGPADADLSGFYLTDTLTNKTKFRIPNGYSVPAGGFLLVWADSAPNLNDPQRPELHVNFSLARGGEALGLFAPDGTQVDAVLFGPQTDDVSQGRFPNGVGTVHFFQNPTPGAPNVVGGNSPPVLSPIPDQVVYLGRSLSLTAQATDPDQGQSLSFALTDSPQGAVIHSVTGLLTWTPSPAQAPSTNIFTVRVADNGSPSLSATRSFQVIVAIPPTVSAGLVTGDQFRFSFDAFPGKRYQIEYKNELSEPAWQPLGAERLAEQSEITATDGFSGRAHRFYRVRLVE